MESFENKPDDARSRASTPAAERRTIVAARLEALPPGHSLSVALADGNEIAVYNVDGQFFATENSCPHHGAPLAEGRLCGHVIECGWHGWQFDVRDGRCLTVSELIPTYRVLVEDGWIKIEI